MEDLTAKLGEEHNRIKEMYIKRKPIENDLISIMSEDKKLNKLLAKIVCGYVNKAFTKEELSKFADIHYGEDIEDYEFETEAEKICSFLGTLTGVIDDFPLDETIEELLSDKDLEDCWRV